MTKVKLLRLGKINIIPDEENIWVCILPSIADLIIKNQHDKPLLEKLIYGLVMMLRTQSMLIGSLGGWLLVKFHPVDELNLAEKFKNDLYRYGRSYREFFAINNFEVGYEPAQYNFSKFIVVNSSSASRYVELLHGAERLIRIKLD